MSEPTAHRPEARWERVAAVALVALPLAILAFPLADPGLQVAARDAGRLYYPLKHFIADELAHGRLPSWNPFLGLGEPLVPALVGGVLDPLNLFVVALPFGWGFKAMHLACYLVAALGVWAWARGRQLSSAACAGAAAAFALSGYLTGIANNFVYLRGLSSAVLFVAAFEWAVRGGKALRMGAAAAAWALVLLGGEPQSWLLAFLFALALALSEPGAERKTVLIRAAQIGLLGVLLSAPVLVPAALEFPRTDRATLGLAATASQWWFTPSRAVELAFPHLLRADEGANPVYLALFGARRAVPWVPSQYLGVCVLLLAALGVRGRGGGAVLALAVLALWLAAGPVLGAERLGSGIPVWRSFQYPEKLVGWAALAFSLLAGLGLERLLQGLASPKRLALAAGAAVLVFAAVGVLAGSFGTDLAHPAGATLRANLRHGALHATVVLGLACLSAWLLRARPRVLAVVLVGLVAADLTAANSLRPAVLPAPVLEVNSPLADWIQRNDPLARIATPFEYAEGGPTTATDQFTLWSRTLVPLWNVEARVGNMGWYGGLASARYRLLREAGIPGWRYLEAAAAHGTGYVVVPGAIDNLAKIGLPAQDVVATDPRVPASLVRVAHRPFAYLAPRTEPADGDGALAAVLTPGFAAGDRSLVEAPAGELPPACEGAGEATAHCEAPTRCRIELTSPCPRMLVINLPPAPGWAFTLDGREVEPSPANFLASAVRVPEGRHVVELAYSAPGLAVGGMLALLGAALIGLAVLRQRRAASEPALAPGTPATGGR